MKETIWKFTLQATDIQTIKMPKGAKILCVQTQNEIPCLWAIVDPSASMEDRTFSIYGTGHNIDGYDRKYLGTFQLLKGNFIGHLFEQTI